MTQCNSQATELNVGVFASFLSDEEIAGLLVMTVDWVRSHAAEIPGFARLGTYYRFRRPAIEQWLGALDRLLEAEQVGTFLKVPISWVYANADDIPGVLRLGRYVRFRPAMISQFLTGSGVVQ